MYYLPIGASPNMAILRLVVIDATVCNLFTAPYLRATMPRTPFV
jgi:hypothetical protein